jgi:hypothetical protein
MDALPGGCLYCSPMLRRLLPTLLIPVLLAGCILPGTTGAPTAYPAGYMPTVIYLTAQSINATVSAGVTPTLVPTDTPTFIPPTPFPTNTPTAAPGYSLAAIQINKPGPGSRVASPLEIQFLAVAGDSKKMDISLFGEDGRLLAELIRAVPGHPTGDFLSLKIPFEIRAAAEVGILVVSTKDKLGRLQSLSTVRILLLSSGVSQVNPPGNAIYERATFLHLKPNADVSGGLLSLQGQYTPYNGQPVIVELISDTGQGLSLRVLDFPGIDPQYFNTTLPYKVSKPTPARLYIHQEDDVLKGPAYVYSQEIILNP